MGVHLDNVKITGVQTDMGAYVIGTYGNGDIFVNNSQISYSNGGVIGGREVYIHNTLIDGGYRSSTLYGCIYASNGLFMESSKVHGYHAASSAIAYADTFASLKNVSIENCLTHCSMIESGEQLHADGLTMWNVSSSGFGTCLVSDYVNVQNSNFKVFTGSGSRSGGCIVGYTFVYLKNTIFSRGLGSNPGLVVHQSNPGGHVILTNVTIEYIVSLNHLIDA